MKLALNQGLSGAASLSGDLERVLEAERLGYDSVWTSESYGSDAVTTATWIAARTQGQRIRERLAVWKTAGVTTLGVRGKIEAIRLMAELAL